MKFRLKTVRQRFAPAIKGTEEAINNYKSLGFTFDMDQTAFDMWKAVIYHINQQEIELNTLEDLIELARKCKVVGRYTDSPLILNVAENPDNTHELTIYDDYIE